jgi:hypothetical protein
VETARKTSGNRAEMGGVANRNSLFSNMLWRFPRVFCFLPPKPRSSWGYCHPLECGALSPLSPSRSGFALAAVYDQIVAWRGIDERFAENLKPLRRPRPWVHGARRKAAINRRTPNLAAHRVAIPAGGPRAGGFCLAASARTKLSKNIDRTQHAIRRHGRHLFPRTVLIHSCEVRKPAGLAARNEIQARDLPSSQYINIYT